MEELKREKADEEALRKIFEELEFKTLTERIFKKEKKPAQSELPKNDFPDLFAAEYPEEEKYSNLVKLNSLPYDYQLIDTEEKIAELVQIL